MKIEGPLITAFFVNRPNRFITIIEIDGKRYKSHLPDPGKAQRVAYSWSNFIGLGLPIRAIKD